jgi:hypothetical protein
VVEKVSTIEILLVDIIGVSFEFLERTAVLTVNDIVLHDVVG